VDARDWNLFLGAQAAREDFSGAAQSERRFSVRDENLKEGMMGGGGKISFLYVERYIRRR
jgi:hypothetical protein